MNLNNKNIEKILQEPVTRKALAFQSHIWFFHIYLNKYVKYETADFQKEIFGITENSSVNKAAIVAFRGSAKSTIMTLSYPIWAALCTPQKKFIVIISSTQKQSKLMLENLKKELETNPLLKADFGPFIKKGSQWKGDSIVLNKTGTRITAISSNESVRGIRHIDTRPDLIILDDVEDMDSVRTRDARNKTWQWYTGEIAPLGDKDTKICVIGNMLHEDSFMMRMKEDIAKRGNRKHRYLEIPLIDDQGVCLWPGKYRTREELDDLMDNTDEIPWHREYLLQIIPDEDAVIRREWLKYYDHLPEDTYLQYFVGSVDLAISKKDSADYTAIIKAMLYQVDGQYRVYILPDPINKRLSFPETIETIKMIVGEVDDDNHVRRIIVEGVGYQRAVVQQLEELGIAAEEVTVVGSDKRARLSQVSNFVKQGKVLFPKEGVDALIDQIVNFGVEKHDDLADAFSMLLLQLINELTAKPSIGYIATHNLYDLPWDEYSSGHNWG